VELYQHSPYVLMANCIVPLFSTTPIIIVTWLSWHLFCAYFCKA